MPDINFGDWVFRIVDDIQQFSWKAVLFRQTRDGSDVFTWDGKCHHIPPNEKFPDGAAIDFSPDMLQALMDGLWKFGTRPHDKRYEEEAKLRDAHLQDMRKLVFKDIP